MRTDSQGLSHVEHVWTLVRNLGGGFDVVGILSMSVTSYNVHFKAVCYPVPGCTLELHRAVF